MVAFKDDMMGQEVFNHESYQGRAMYTPLNDATARLTLDLLHLKYLLLELHYAVFASLSDLWAAMGV